MSDIEEQRADFQAKLDKGKERLENIKGTLGAFNFLVDIAGDELGIAYDAYMEADTEEAWAKFDDQAKRAGFNLRCALLDLYKLAETEPSLVEPETIQWLKDTIDNIGNIRINFWQKWGKQVKADREAVRRPTGKPTCPAQVLHGITDMRTPEAIGFCLGRCEYQDRCDLPIPKTGRRY